MKRMTEQYLKQQLAAGRIRGYSKPTSKAPATGGRKVGKHFAKRSKEKDWLSWNLLFYCNEHCLRLEEEYKFHEARKWRFDWCIPSLKIAIEYEGINSAKSRHTTMKGYTGDSNKYNSAQARGYRVIRLTVLNYKTLFSQLNEFVKDGRRI
jgi:hypothetical protein